MTICPVCFTILSGNSDDIDALEPDLCSQECSDVWDETTFGEEGDMTYKSRLEEIQQYVKSGGGHFDSYELDVIRDLLAVVDAILTGNTPDHMVAHLEFYREENGWWSAEHNCAAVIDALKELA